MFTQCVLLVARVGRRSDVRASRYSAWLGLVITPRPALLSDPAGNPPRPPERLGDGVDVSNPASPSVRTRVCVSLLLSSSCILVSAYGACLPLPLRVDSSPRRGRSRRSQTCTYIVSCLWACVSPSPPCCVAFRFCELPSRISVEWEPRILNIHLNLTCTKPHLLNVVAVG